MKFREAFREGRRQAVLTQAKKKATSYQEGNRITFTYMATGRFERDTLLAEGWRVTHQDVSEMGAWVTRWLMEKQEILEP